MEETVKGGGGFSPSREGTLLQAEVKQASDGDIFGGFPGIGRGLD